MRTRLTMSESHVPHRGGYGGHVRAWRLTLHKVTLGAQALGDLQTVRRSPARVTIRSITRFQVPTPAHCTSSRPCCAWAGRMSHGPQKRHLIHVLTVHGSLAELSGGSHLSLSPHLLPMRYGIKPWHRRLLGCRAARPSPRLMIHVEISVCNAVWYQYLGSFLSRL